MKKLVLILCLMTAVSSFAAGTNTVFSSTNTLYIIGTNRTALSNEIVAASALANSNLLYNVSNLTYTISNNNYLLTNGTVPATNFAVVSPGPLTNWMRLTNGTLRGITNAAP